MNLRNGYATLTDYKSYHTITSTDLTDDAVINQLLEGASRLLDSKTGRKFYPTIETLKYDLPKTPILYVEDDLLELTTLTNGDNTTISSANYFLHSPNATPYWGVELNTTSNITWQANTNGNEKQVISILGLFGFRDKYSMQAWKTGGTLGAAMTDTTTLAFTMTAGHTLSFGQILRIDNEILIVDTVSTNTITPTKRGDNGSTAATHLNGATVSVWQPMEEARNAVCEIANLAYTRRNGQTAGGVAQVTAAGVVISPRDIPALAEEFIRTYQRL